jgi:hypothetical protein
VVTGRFRPTVGFVQPSSLIFLVIVVIWATFLIQHWVRRREHVATARSVDRFSEAMRVLERRSPLPSPELSAPRPHSYAVKPAPARSAVTVKRAALVQAAPRGAQVTAMVADRQATRSPLSARSTASAPTVAHPSRSAGGSTAVRPVAGRRPTRSPSAIPLRKVRGVSFLVTLSAIPVTAVLAAVHVLLWVSVAIAVVAFAAVVVWLRTCVLREQTARAGARIPAARRSTAAAARASAVTPTVETPAAPPTAPPARAAAAVFDVNASGATAEVAEVAEVAAAVDQQVSLEAGVPGGWSPVPVPPPTYTLKDTATRVRPEPSEVTQTPVPIEVEDDDIERMAVQHRRKVVGG